MSIEEELGQLLTVRKLTVGLAESCTGGLVGHRLTNVPGSSAYFMGGVVAYSYEAKEQLLDVRHNTLYDHGAVSEPVAREMAQGARRVFGADLGIAVTGIAGPGGGMPGKPVGLTWVCVSARGREIARKLQFDSDRQGNKEQAAEAALSLLLEVLLGTLN